MSIIIPKELQHEFDAAKEELGTERYNKLLRNAFGKPVLCFAKTLVINLPGSCNANCEYCIDKCLRKTATNVEDFLNVCELTFKEFPEMEHLTITGGSLSAKDFNRLVALIRKYYKQINITWNTNGVLINEDYDVDGFKYINLHRNSPDDEENRRIFVTNKDILSIEEAKRIFGDKLSVRVTIDKDFRLEDYLQFGTKLYLNKMLPETPETQKVFEETLNRLIVDKKDTRRRNRYLDCNYEGTAIRICPGDAIASKEKGKYPTYLNVVIIHRSGKVCGSWYEDVKVLRG